jgi:hypothetical protein
MTHTSIVNTENRKGFPELISTDQVLLTTIKKNVAAKQEATPHHQRFKNNGMKCHLDRSSKSLPYSQ